MEASPRLTPNTAQPPLCPPTHQWQLHPGSRPRRHSHHCAILLISGSFTQVHAQDCTATIVPSYSSAAASPRLTPKAAQLPLCLPTHQWQLHPGSRPRLHSHHCALLLISGSFTQAHAQGCTATIVPSYSSAAASPRLTPKAAQPPLCPPTHQRQLHPGSRPRLHSHHCALLLISGSFTQAHAQGCTATIVPSYSSAAASPRLTPKAAQPPLCPPTHQRQLHPGSRPRLHSHHCALLLISGSFTQAHAQGCTATIVPSYSSAAASPRLTPKAAQPPLCPPTHQRQLHPGSRPRLHSHHCALLLISGSFTQAHAQGCTATIVPSYSSAAASPRLTPKAAQPPLCPPTHQRQLHPGSRPRLHSHHCALLLISGSFTQAHAQGCTATIVPSYSSAAASPRLTPKAAQPPLCPPTHQWQLHPGSRPRLHSHHCALLATVVPDMVVIAKPIRL